MKHPEVGMRLERGYFSTARSHIAHTSGLSTGTPWYLKTVEELLKGEEEKESGGNDKNPVSLMTNESPRHTSVVHPTIEEIFQASTTTSAGNAFLSRDSSGNSTLSTTPPTEEMAKTNVMTKTPQKRIAQTLDPVQQHLADISKRRLRRGQLLDELALVDADLQRLREEENMQERVLQQAAALVASRVKQLILAKEELLLAYSRSCEALLAAKAAEKPLPSTLSPPPPPPTFPRPPPPPPPPSSSHHRSMSTLASTSSTSASKHSRPAPPSVPPPRPPPPAHPPPKNIPRPSRVAFSDTNDSTFPRETKISSPKQIKEHRDRVMRLLLLDQRVQSAWLRARRGFSRLAREIIKRPDGRAKLPFPPPPHSPLSTTLPGLPAGLVARMDSQAVVIATATVAGSGQRRASVYRPRRSSSRG